jgi:hypothetical protein
MNGPIIPSKNPASDGRLSAVVEFAFKKMMQNNDGQLPAKVISYDRVKNIAIVQPLICLILTNGQRQDRAPIAKVPVLALGGGGYFINFPLKKDDTGWIEASDRDISLYMQGSGDIAPPNQLDLHSFEFGRFVPDVFADYTIAGGDSGAMVISSLDGSVKITLSAGKIALTAAEIDLNGTSINLNAPTLTTTATTTNMAGLVNMPGGADIGGIPFGTHVHGGVLRGLMDTDGPQ